MTRSDAALLELIGNESGADVRINPVVYSIRVMGTVLAATVFGVRVCACGWHGAWGSCTLYFVHIAKAGDRRCCVKAMRATLQAIVYGAHVIARRLAPAVATANAATSGTAARAGRSIRLRIDPLLDRGRSVRRLAAHTPVPRAAVGPRPLQHLGSAGPGGQGCQNDGEVGR